MAALAPVDVLRRAPVEITDLAYDARDAGPGSLFFCVPGSRADGHDFAHDAVANGAVALVVERPLELDVPQLVVPSARRAMAPGRGRALRAPEPGARDRRRDRHERQDDDCVPALLDPRGCGPAPGVARDDRVPRRRRAAARDPDDPRGDRPAAGVPRDARRGRPQLRARSDLARLGAGAARPCALRRARLHEPDAGPPRLPRNPRALLRCQAPAFHRDSTARCRERGRRPRAGARG